MPITATSNALPIVVMLGITGAAINAIQTTLYALAAHVYPTAVRATGVGTAVAFGRIGGVMSSYAGEWALGVGGSSAFFALMAGVHGRRIPLPVARRTPCAAAGALHHGAIRYRSRILSLEGDSGDHEFIGLMPIQSIRPLMSPASLYLLLLTCDTQPKCLLTAVRLPPHLPRGFDNQRQLRHLFLDRERVPLDRR